MNARILTPRERKFCEFVAAGYSATQAARNAGYSDKGSGASVAGVRLMHRPEIIAEIQRLRQKGEAAGDAIVRRTLVQAVSGGRIPNDAAEKVGPHIIAGMTRGFQQHALVTATQMALGELSMPRSVVIRPRPTEADPNPEPIVYEALVRLADPKAVAVCATALGKEIDRMEGLPTDPNTIDGTLAEDESPLSRALDAWAKRNNIAPVPEGYDPEKEP